MNFHPNAFEQGYAEHEGTGLTAPTFKAVAKVFNQQIKGAYKGNATAAIQEVLEKEKAIKNPAYLAWWITTVCREMAWYDPDTLTEDGRMARRKLLVDFPLTSGRKSGT